MSFGGKLKEVRKDKGLEAQYVAKKLNVAKSTYSGYENDKTKPSFEILQEISKLLQVSTDYLLGLSDDTNKPDNIAKTDLGEEQILTMAAHKVGHDGPLSDIDMFMIRKAIKIALDK